MSWEHDSATLSPSESVHISCAFVPPNTYYTCFSTFHLWGSSFLPSWRAWALTFGLVAGIWYPHRYDPSSISDPEPKPCSESLQAEATQGQSELNFLILNNKVQSLEKKILFCWDGNSKNEKRRKLWLPKSHLNSKKQIKSFLLVSILLLLL